MLRAPAIACDAAEPAATIPSCCALVSRSPSSRCASRTVTTGYSEPSTETSESSPWPLAKREERVRRDVGEPDGRDRPQGRARDAKRRARHQRDREQQRRASRRARRRASRARRPRGCRGRGSRRRARARAPRRAPARLPGRAPATRRAAPRPTRAPRPRARLPAPPNASADGRSPVAIAIVNGHDRAAGDERRDDAHRPERERAVERGEPRAAAEPGQRAEPERARPSTLPRTPTATSSTMNPAACETTRDGEHGQALRQRAAGEVRRCPRRPTRRARVTRARALRAARRAWPCPGRRRRTSSRARSSCRASPGRSAACS